MKEILWSEKTVSCICLVLDILVCATDKEYHCIGSIYIGSVVLSVVLTSISTPSTRAPSLSLTSDSHHAGFHWLYKVGWILLSPTEEQMFFI